MKRFVPMVVMGLSAAMVLVCLSFGDSLRTTEAAVPVGAAPLNADADRSPVDVVLTPDEQWLVTANQTSGTLSLVEIASGRVAAEVACGRRPSAIAITADGRTVLATARDSGELWVYTLDTGGSATLTLRGKVRLGFHPWGVAASPDGREAYVALSAGSAVAVVDVAKLNETRRIEVDHWPHHVAVTPDGKKLAVGCSGKRSIVVIDTSKREVLFRQYYEAINIGHLVTSRDGQRVYAPSMVYRQNPISVQNIRIGWVLASRIGYIGLDRPARRFAIALDVPRKAMSDPYGLAMTSDESHVVCTSSGTHELLVYQMEGLPFSDTPGPGDLVDGRLAGDRRRFARIELGGRPMGVRIARDNRRAFVANYLSNSVQVVDLESRTVARTIDLGGPSEPSLARRGEAIFYDARRSLDQWYSCHSCHQEGGSNAVAMDTLNDGTNRTFKTVLPLFHVTETAPWTWHGWQTDLNAAMHKSMTDTMQGPKPSDDDVAALVAYLKALAPPPNPHLAADGRLTPSAERGKKVFLSETAGCANCHSGKYLTDGKVHDVGLGAPKDRYRGYNTPSLLGLYQKVRYLHSGRATSLEALLTKYHNPAEVTGFGELSDADRRDLIEYLRSL